MKLPVAISGAAVALLLAGFTGSARAETEYPPASGKGPVVVVVSGHYGASTYQPPARKIAALGYDVILLDSRDMTRAASLQAAVRQAQSSPHGLPGKVGVVGFSQGGGELLQNATQWPDLVAVVVLWYPVTSSISDVPTFARAIKVPVLMFAGESDLQETHCCTIKAARDLGAAATAAGAPLQLVTYANAGHDFVLEWHHNYNAAAVADSWQRATAKLAQYLAH